MAATEELNAEDFFASRSGVCVYVTVRRHRFRVQFVAIDAHGVVSEPTHADAEEARRLARAALDRHAASLASLFAEVARRTT